MPGRRDSFLFLVLVLASGCRAGQSGTPVAQKPNRAITVRVATAQAQDLVYQVKALGSLEAEEKVQITAEVEGPVSAVRFNEGARVGPQTVLATIDPERYRLEASRAESNFKKAVADARRSQADSERREELAREDLVAHEELNRSRGETERLAAEAEAARAAWDIALQNLRRSAVRAPRAGVIDTRSVDTGQWVKLGTLLATLVDTSRLRLRFKVSDAESLYARPGQSVKFRVGALGDRDFAAALYHVGEVADPASRQVEVLAWVQNPGVLKPGFFAEVTLSTASRKGAIVVPEGAIQASERGFVAYVVVGDKARLREIQIGLRTGTGTVEILSGIAAGDSVVIEGSDRLADGVSVAPTAGPSPAKSAR